MTPIPAERPCDVCYRIEPVSIFIEVTRVVARCVCSALVMPPVLLVRP